jgi:hypothetical protein
MINPKEKADELVKEMYKVHSNSASLVTLYFAKQCALIAVKFAKENPLNSDGYNKYLDEVEQEIEKIGGEQ